MNKDRSPEEGQRPWLQQKTLHIDPGFYNFNLFQDVPCGQLKTNYVNLYPFTVGFFFLLKDEKWWSRWDGQELIHSGIHKLFQYFIRAISKDVRLQWGHSEITSRFWRVYYHIQMTITSLNELYNGYDEAFHSASLIIVTCRLYTGELPEIALFQQFVISPYVTKGDKSQHN